MGELEESDYDEARLREKQIILLKAEIFDSLESQGRLQSQIEQIERTKQQKVAELNKIRTG